MKKSFIAALVLVCVLLLLYSQRGQLALRLVEREAERAMTQDATAELVDGLHVMLCGAGSQLFDPQRSGPCVAVIAGQQLFIVDAGTGGLRNLARAGYPIGDIEVVLLTRLHSSHIDGLGELSTSRWVNGANTSPLPIMGPDGVEEIVRGYNAAYRRDSAYRNDRHGDAVAPLAGAGMVAQAFVAPPPGELSAVYTGDNLRIDALTVQDATAHPAVGYLFTYKDRTVLITGATTRQDNVRQFAAGVDLLVHEALSHRIVAIMSDAAARAGNTAMASMTRDMLDHHTDALQAAETARDANVGHLLFYHMVSPLVIPGMEAAWSEGIDAVFRRYTLGEDGTAFSLPAGSNAIELANEGGS